MAGVAVGLAAAAIAFVVLRLWVGSFAVPISYAGDSNQVLLTVKGTIEGGWYYENGMVGAPFELESYDFPHGGHLQIAGFKVVGWLTGGDVGLTINLNFLIGFLAIGAVAYWVLRRLEVSRPWAAALGVLYSLTPFHFDRTIVHYYLSVYLAAPLAILLAVNQAQRTPAFVIAGSDGDRLSLSWRSRETRTAVVAGAVIASTGGYFAVFSTVILLAVAVFGYVATRERLRAASTVLVAAVIGVSLILSMAPTVVYRLENGPNTNLGGRLYAEGDRYALKPLNMLLPIADHRIEVLGAPMRRSLTGLRSEGGQNLGIVGAVGLASLVTIALSSLVGGPGRFSAQSRLLAGLAVGITLAAVVGGYAAIFGLVGLTLIRAWNRISVFIGFVALLAVGIWLTRWWRDRRPVMAWGLASLLVLVGSLDQSAPVSDDPALAREAEWDSDAEFVARIEAVLPAGAMVYQLPYVSYPETPAVHRMAEYDLLKGYLHSTDLRWSYPAMRGRVPDWQPALLSHGVGDALERLVAVGFDGIYVDRFGYADAAAELEAALSAHLDQDPIVSGNGRLSFFDLRSFAFELRSRLGEFELEALAKETLGVEELPGR